MTKNEKKAFNFIRYYISKHGISPTENEIAKSLGWSSRGSAHRIVSSLIRKGLIETSDSSTRKIRIKKKKLFSKNYYSISEFSEGLSSGEIINEFKCVDVDGKDVVFTVTAEFYS